MKNYLRLAAYCLAFFVAWTVLAVAGDTRPRASIVGLAPCPGSVLNVDVSGAFFAPDSSGTAALHVGGASQTYTATWESGGMTVTVTTTPEQGESHASARARFVTEVRALLEVFPPEQGGA